MFDFNSNLRSFNLRNLNLRIFDLLAFTSRISITTLQDSQITQSLAVCACRCNNSLLNLPTRAAYVSNDRATMLL
jgi:hypothetical protein